MQHLNNSTTAEQPITFNSKPAPWNKRLSTNAGLNQQKLLRLCAKAISDYQMISDGDRLLIAMSGGKDSYVLSRLMQLLQASAPVRFSMIAVNIDQNHPGYPKHIIGDYCKKVQLDYRQHWQNSYQVVQDKIPAGKNKCSLCSRLRRGALYHIAKEERANKILLGHHANDVLETLFLNMFHGGRLKAMPAKLQSDDKQHMILRPLVYCFEKDIAKLANTLEFPIIPCDLCGSEPNSQRQELKRWLLDMEKNHPGRLASILRSLSHPVYSHLLDPSAMPDATNATDDTDAK